MFSSIRKSGAIASLIFLNFCLELPRFFSATRCFLKSGVFYLCIVVWPSLHNAYAYVLDSWHQAEVGGSPRLKLLPHGMHASFRNDSREAMEASPATIAPLASACSRSRIPQIAAGTQRCFSVFLAEIAEWLIAMATECSFDSL